MLRERLKSILRGPRSSAAASPPVSGMGQPRFAARSGDKELSRSRLSRGLEQFFGCFAGQTGLTMLDLGGANQQNVNFITSLGHKFYSEDFLRAFEEIFAGRGLEPLPSPVEYAKSRS